MSLLVRCEPNVRSCLQRLTSLSLLNAFEIREDGRPLSAELRKTIDVEYMTFLRGSVTMMFMCGFVAFAVKKKEGTPIPFLLPLGSFTWSSAVPPKKSSQAISRLLAYEIKLIADIGVEEKDVTVVEWIPPAVGVPGVLQSPMINLLDEYLGLKAHQEMLKHAVAWNAQRHIAVSERVDLKDQTSSGIALLDEFRRYAVSGRVSQYHAMLRLRNANNETLQTANDASMYWIKNEFSEIGQHASIHFLPPNMQVQELQAIPLQSLGTQESSTMFSKSVHSFFNMDMPEYAQDAKAGHDAVSRSSHDQATIVCQFLESVIAQAYSTSFKVPLSRVQASLRPQARLGLSSTQDVKHLADAQMLMPGHASRVHDMFGLNERRDAKKRSRSD